MSVDSWLTTLGSFDLRVGSRPVPPPPTQKGRALIAFLSLNRGRDIARERLIEMFWTDSEPERAREGLRTALSTVRRVLRDAGVDPEAIFLADKSVVRWIAPTLLDSERFSELCRSVDAQSRASAMSLYAGEFLEGNYERWAVTERERLSSLYETLLAADLRSTGNTETARKLLARNPYDEIAYAALIEAELDANRPIVAAELLTRCRRALADVGAALSPSIESRLARVPDLTDSAKPALRIPFVARVTELQQLQHGLDQPSSAVGFAALIVGEPGIGKSALMMEAAARARRSGRRCLFVRCIQDDIRRMGCWQPLYERVTGRSIDEIASSDAAKLVAHSIVTSLDNRTVILVDDVHALRGESAEVFAQVARLARLSGCALIFASRPEGIARGDPGLAEGVDVTIALGPFEPGDIEAAVALTVGEGSAGLAGLLYRRSGGHPLFFTALLDSLAQQRVLQWGGSRWRVLPTVDRRLELPPSLRVSVEARLRAAGEDAVAVACAFALEPSATAEDLAFVLGYAETRLFDAIDDLMIRDLVREDSTPLQYEFRHDIVREVAAVLLNSGRRVAMHRAFARRFASSSRPETTSSLARHLKAAGMMIPAAGAYYDAARAALTRFSFRDAIQYCSEGIAALERTSAGADVTAVLSRLNLVSAQAFANAGETARAIVAAGDAVRHARESGEPSIVLEALVVRAALHGALAEVSAQQTDASEAFALAAETDEPRLRGRAAVESAAAARSSGDAEEAFRLAREACKDAYRAGDAVTLYAAYEELLKTQLFWWRFDEARRTLAEAAAIAEKAGVSAQARLCCVRAARDYLTEDFEGAALELRTAAQFAEFLWNGGEPRAPDVTYPALLIPFTVHYLTGVVACARNDVRLLTDAITRCSESESLMRLPRYGNAVALLEIDALLDRNDGESIRCAIEIAGALAAGSGPVSIFGWSNCLALAKARVYTRARSATARSMLRTALDTIEENARRIPLDCDRSFAQLAKAAEEIGEVGIRDRSLARSSHFHALRMSAATLR